MHLIRSVMLSFLLGAFAVLAASMAASAQIVISVGVPPPPLPDYDQPVIPADGYIWTPGYWAYDDEFGYYWVPGTWIEPPQQGLLWTPGYWGFDNGNYVYYDGYWGDEVGYYGGVDYGYGYGGSGYEGGYWQGGHFFYNRTVNNITDVNVTNIYSKTVITNPTVDRVSYNGGEGGLMVRPTEQQQAFAHQHHIQPTALQREHVQMAARDPSLREAQNKGRPPIAATSRPNDFKGQGVVAARTAGARPAGEMMPQGKRRIGASGPKPEERRANMPGEMPNAVEKKPGGPQNEPRNAMPVEPKPAANRQNVEGRRMEPKPYAKPQIEERRAEPEERGPAAAPRSGMESRPQPRQQEKNDKRPRQF